MNTSPEITDARHASPYSFREKVGRVLWSVCEATLFRYSWPTWYSYRAWLLRRFGATIARNAFVRRTVRITCPWNLTMGPDSAIGHEARIYALGQITLGARSTVSQYTHLCAGSHDHTQLDMPLQRPPIRILDDAWIAADAFVGPGVTVGTGAILGSRGCAFKDLDAWIIYGGNPARVIGARQAWNTHSTREATA